MQKPWLQKPETAAPAGSAWYETMLLLRPDSTPVERADTVGKIKSFLQKRGAASMEASVRDAAKASYPVKGHSEVHYVQMFYTAPPQAVQELHAMFALPVVGAEPVMLRFMTFKQSK